MGKSSKKSNVEVAAAPVLAPLAKSAKKGKRDAEETIVKPVSAKKQKGEVEELVPKQEKDNKKSKKASQEPLPKKDNKKSKKASQEPLPKKDNKKSKKASQEPLPKKKAESSSSEELTSSESEEEVPTKVTAPSKKLPLTGAKNGKPAISKKQQESSDSDSPDEDAKPAASVKKPPVAVSKKKPESSETSSGSDSDEEDELRNKSKADESSEESSDESDEEPQTKKKVPDTVPANVGKPSVIPVKEESSSEEDEDDSSEESSDEEPSKPQHIKKPTKPSAESSSSEDEDSSDEESEDERPMKTPQKKDSDVKMKDAPSVKTTGKHTATKSEEELKTPASSRSSGTKTLFVGNLSFDAGQDDVAEFFKEAGEIVEVRLAVADDGRFKGFGHVEFATEEAAQKALEMNGGELLGRAVRLDLAREKGAYTPSNGKEGNSYQKSGKGPSHTIFVKGFDRSLVEDKIRESLEEHFGSCGEITRVSLPKDYETGAFKGMAYMDFTEPDAFSKALELDGSELGGYTLAVDEAKPRGDSRSGGWSGGKDSAGRGGGRGRFGGQRGGRGRGGGGRGRGGGGRGR